MKSLSELTDRDWDIIKLLVLRQAAKVAHHTAILPDIARRLINLGLQDIDAALCELEPFVLAVLTITVSNLTVRSDADSAAHELPLHEIAQAMHALRSAAHLN